MQKVQSASDLSQHTYMNDLASYYTKEIVPKMKKQFGYANILQVPRITKITVNVGVSKGLKDAQFIGTVEENLARITGQRPVKTKAKKSIATFKIREGMVVGVKVTLRKKRMYDFLNKLLTFVFPRTRDFRGVSESIIDKQGNCNVGFKENIAFPEIKSDELERIHGLEVTLSTNASSREEGLALFRYFGFPFKEQHKK